MKINTTHAKPSKLQILETAIITPRNTPLFPTIIDTTSEYRAIGRLLLSWLLATGYYLAGYWLLATVAIVATFLYYPSFDCKSRLELFRKSDAL
eukprot:scaffold893_cov110-Skeletonema_dohrnii-CCMP3373.AAC.1